MAVPELGVLFQMDELNIALLVDHSRPMFSLSCARARPRSCFDPFA